MRLKPGMIVLLVLTILLGAGGCSEQREAARASRLPVARVQVEAVSLTTLPSQVEIAGTVQAREQAQIAARVSGQVTEVPVRVGSLVKKGDLLVRLSAAELRAQAQRAETQLAQARRNLERETRLAQANASTRELVKSLEEAAQIAEAAFRETQVMLDYTSIRAPFAGTVTRKSADVGDLAAPGMALLQLENGRSLEVLVQIPEGLAAGLAVGKTLGLTVASVGLKVDAAISELAPTVDPQTRTTQVKLLLPEHPLLRSGQFARVALADAGAQALLIPAAAVQPKGQMLQVFVAEQNVARLRLVRTGTRYGELVEVLTGLQPQDRLILPVPAGLQDGQPLEIVEGEKTQ